MAPFLSGVRRTIREPRHNWGLKALKERRTVMVLPIRSTELPVAEGVGSPPLLSANPRACEPW